MIVQCPSCHFERNVPDTALRPGKTYKVTCPRCSSVFQFAMPEPEEFIFEPEVPADAQPEPKPEVQAESPVVRQESEPAVEPAAASVESRIEEEGSAAQQVKEPEIPATHQAAEQEGGEAQPSGDIPTPAQEEPKQDSAQQDESAQGNTWDSWKQHAEEDPANGRDHTDDTPHRDDGRPDGAPWESPEYYGFLGSFSRTLLGVLFHAPDFFRHVKCQFSVIRPILFYVFMSLFQVLCARLWSIKALRELSATATDPQTLAMAEQLMQSMNMPLMLLITPFFSIFQAVILAGIYHLMIRMVQPDRADYATTLRVVCYSAAPLVLCLVPMFGSLIATVWSVLTVFVGCRYALKLSWLRTVLALLPLYILELAFISQLPALMAV